MNLKVIRYEFSSTSTIGDLYVDGERFSYTLEDRDRQVQNVGNVLPWTKELKVQNETAIPHGTYEIIINWSNRFQQPMPLLLNVPDFLGVRVHTGSYAGYEKFLMNLPLTIHPSMSILNTNEYVEVYDD